jgi:hypothetical protein
MAFQVLVALAYHSFRRIARTVPGKSAIIPPGKEAAAVVKPNHHGGLPPYPMKITVRSLIRIRVGATAELNIPPTGESA